MHFIYYKGYKTLHHANNMPLGCLTDNRNITIKFDWFFLLSYFINGLWYCDKKCPIYVKKMSYLI